jgi:hypothetical protein
VGTRTKISEGLWFAVPLRGGGYGVGVVARRNSEGVLLGYFFGPKRAEVPTDTGIDGLRPEAAILVARVGHLGLRSGEWPVIGGSAAWDRGAWPIPEFGHADLLVEERYTARTYDETLNLFVRERRIGSEEFGGLPADGLMGAGFLEKRLTRLLG